MHNFQDVLLSSIRLVQVGLGQVQLSNVLFFFFFYLLFRCFIQFLQGMIIIHYFLSEQYGSVYTIPILSMLHYLSDLTVDTHFKEYILTQVFWRGKYLQSCGYFMLNLHGLTALHLPIKPESYEGASTFLHRKAKN